MSLKTDLNSLSTNEAVADAAPVGLASFKEAFESLLKHRPGMLASESGGELAWLNKARVRDAQRWQNEGLPTRRDEQWHYTSVAALADSQMVLPTPATHLSAKQRADFPRIAESDQHEIVFYNGQFVSQWSNLEVGDGVSVIILSQLLSECVNEGWTTERKERFAAFRKHIESSDTNRENVFAAMNTSLMQDGLLIHVQAGVVLKKPIIVTYISDSQVPAGSQEMALMSPRIFAHLEKGAEAGLIEFHAGCRDHRYFSNVVSDVRLEERARLSYSKVQSEGNEGYHIGTTRIHQKRDSFAEAFQFSFGARLSRQDLHISLEGEGAEAILDGLYLVSGKQHVDHHTNIEHVVPHTTSGQIYKGILADQAHAVFNGRVAIHRGAQKSNSSQLNNNLLLSSKAEVDTKPELEIDADDVKAAHGATIGQIDPDHVFYLQTRSIPRSQAVRMLARGFAQDVVFRIRNPEIRARMGLLVDERFDALPIGEEIEGANGIKH